MKEEEIPKLLRAKIHIGVYVEMYASLYLEEKSKRIGLSMGKVLQELIVNQPDFKEIISEHLSFASESILKKA